MLELLLGILKTSMVDMYFELVDRDVLWLSDHSPSDTIDNVSFISSLSAKALDSKV